MKKIVINAEYLSKALPPMSESFERETRAVLDSLRDEPQQPVIMRRKLSTGLVLALIALIVLAGVSLAALRWGSLSFITRTGPDGETHVNQSLPPLIQSIDKTFESDALRVHVIDAIYDGRSVVTTWTVENKLNERIYLLQYSTYNDEADGMGSGFNETDLFIDPGQTIECARTTALLQNERYDADDCDIMMHFFAMRPTGPIVERWPENSLEPLYTDEDVDALLDDGYVVVEFDRFLSLGNHWPDAYTSNVDLYEKAGVLELVDTLDGLFSIAKNAHARVGKIIDPDTGPDTELRYDPFSIRLRRAELSPNTFYILLEAVFADEDTAWKYRWGGAIDLDPLEILQGMETPYALRLRLLDGDGGEYLSPYGNNCVVTNNKPRQLPDGTWALDIEIMSLDFEHADSTCRIIPVLIDAETGAIIDESQSLTILYENPAPCQIDEE